MLIKKSCVFFTRGDIVKIGWEDMMSATLDENKIQLESNFSWLIAINYHYILNMQEGVTTDQLQYLKSYFMQIIMHTLTQKCSEICWWIMRLCSLHDYRMNSIIIITPSYQFCATQQDTRAQGSTHKKPIWQIIS